MSYPTHRTYFVHQSQRKIVWKKADQPKLELRFLSDNKFRHFAIFAFPFTRTNNNKFVIMLIMIFMILRRYIFYLVDKISLVIITSAFTYEISSVVALIVYRGVQ
jgi:hypothetical protein